MIGRFLAGIALALVVAASARAQTCASYPTLLTDGTTADASQVMANFNCAALTGAGRFMGTVGVNDGSPSADLSLGTDLTTIKVAAFDGGPSNLYGMGVNSGELTFGAGIAPMGVPQMVLTYSGNVGVATTTPTALLSLGTGLTTIKVAAYDAGGADIYGMGVNSGELTFGAAIAATGLPQMVLTDNGYVGIGTTTPSARLSLGPVISTITVAAYDNGGSEVYGMGVNTNELTFGADIAPTGVAQMVLTNIGNVGIGTTAPTSVLDLSDAITTIKLAVYEDGTPNNTYGIGVNEGELTFGAAISVAGTPQMVLTAGGYLGVGTTTPSYPLYVNGTAFATGAAGALSDRRYKTAIRPLAPGALGIVEKLRPVTFLWKTPTDAGMRGEQIGFIAQEVQETLPTVVLTQNDAQKTLGIKYDELIPVLTAAIQEETARVKALEADVADVKALKEELAAMKTKLTVLEARLASGSAGH